MRTFNRLTAIAAVLLFALMAGAESISLNAEDFKKGATLESNAVIKAELNSKGKYKVESLKFKPGDVVLISVAGSTTELLLREPIKSKVQFGPYPLEQAKKIVNTINN